MDLNVYVSAIYADGMERLGSDHSATRSDLTTEAGARRWALRWLASRPRWNPPMPQWDPVAVRLELRPGGRPYGPATKTFKLYADGRSRRVW